jgi:CMP-N,N'-diacetyllegionaminic acid synthase
LKPRVLGLITARGGSKRLPGKNILPLGGRPLLEWTIDAAQKSKVFCSILLSTDDPGIADVGRNSGAMVPWLRPSHLANDTASSLDVVLHALEWYESEFGAVDAVMLLQPTSPFRSPAMIQRAVDEFVRLEGRTVVSLSPAPIHPAWCFSLSGDRLTPFLGWENMQLPSQQLPPAYMLNGAIYLIQPERLRKDRKFMDENAFPLVMENPMEGLDIDTPFDMSLAQAYCASLL